MALYLIFEEVIHPLSILDLKNTMGCLYLQQGPTWHLYLPAT